MSITVKNIPNDWQLKKLKDVSEFSNGKGHEQSIDENGQYIVVNSKFISTDGRVKKFSSQNLSPLNFGDITMVMSDIPNGKAIAKCFIIDEDNRYTLNQRICSIKSNKNCDTKFLYYVINRNRYYLAFDNGVSQTNFRRDEVLDCPIQFPPLLEQQKIAEILSTVDNKIEVIDQQIIETQALKKGLMQRLLTKGIGHTEFKDSPLGMIPKSWEVVTINEIAEVKGGKRLPKGEVLIENKTEHPYIRVTDMFMGGVSLEKILYVPDNIFPAISRYTISKDDLFISVAGTLGIVGEVPFELDGANLTENADKLTNIKVNKSFLLQLLLSPFIQDLVQKEQTNNAQPKLALTRIKEFIIPKPPNEEQEKIASVLSTVDNKLEILLEKKIHYQELKQGLMQQLLTGKIRVKV